MAAAAEDHEKVCACAGEAGVRAGTVQGGEDVDETELGGRVSWVVVEEGERGRRTKMVVRRMRRVARRKGRAGIVIDGEI